MNNKSATGVALFSRIELDALLTPDAICTNSFYLRRKNKNELLYGYRWH